MDTGVLISRCGVCLSSCYLVSIQHILPQLSAHIAKIKNQNSTVMGGVIIDQLIKMLE